MPRVRPRPAVLASMLGLLVLAGAPPALAAPDPLLADQWALSDPGVREAWTQSRGEGVVVAILDTGVQLDHPDLEANLWTNPGEIAANGIDDDANGFVDDVHGANLLDPAAAVSDADGHGTHVAGIVAATAGNGVGGRGLAPRARIMAVELFDPLRGGSPGRLARGIRYAVDEGARILNVSLKFYGTSPALDGAIAYAATRGATIVAGAGNDSDDIDLHPSFPASSPDPAVLGVTAAGRGGALSSFANRGARSVDLAAPGEEIISTAIGSTFELRSGTSMAAPYVAGALALLAAARPDLGQDRLRDALRATARRSSQLRGLLTDGEVDIGAAMHAVRPGSLWRRATAASRRPRLRLSGSTKVRAGQVATLRWSATNAPGVMEWMVYLGGRRVATRSRPSAAGLRRRLVRPGRYHWKVVGVDAVGAAVVSSTRVLRVERRG